MTVVIHSFDVFDFWIFLVVLYFCYFTFFLNVILACQQFEGDVFFCRIVCFILLYNRCTFQNSNFWKMVMWHEIDIIQNKSFRIYRQQEVCYSLSIIYLNPTGFSFMQQSVYYFKVEIIVTSFKMKSSSPS